MSNKDLNATAAFQDLLKTLCLSEFPCGIGSWRNPKDKFAEGQYSITMKDYGVQHEKMEVLQEYLHSGTWDVDTSWSEEAASLRQLAVSEPWKINKKFIWHYFKTLRLIDKEIVDLDPGMKNLVNLEELTLSVNKLEKILSDRLPPKIKVLELCYNKLQTVSSICKHPPALLHLGLSYNLLASTQEYKYFTAEFWPSLMSLDLSYNNLIELVELVEKLSTLPKLQNLVLLGNPLSLIPGYRGHVIDAIRNLMIFDDTHVSADEKHHFKGLGKKKELILDEAQLVISIADLKGIPMPEELKEDDERPEFPVITTTYVVKYEMLLEEDEVRKGTADDIQRMTSVSWHPDTDIPEENENEEDVLTQSSKRMITTYKTQSLEWDEEGIHIGYKNLHVTDELVGLRDFLKEGIKFVILQEKVHHWPATPIEDDGESPLTPDPKKNKKDGGKDTPAKKGKDAKGKDKGGKGGSAKDKGKKKTGKDSSADMKSDPPIITEIGSYVIPLNSFVEGESEFKKTCHCGGGPMPAVTIDESATPAIPKVDATKSTPGKGKKSPSPDRNTKSRKGSAGKKGASRGADKNRPPSNTSENSEDERMKLPPPITLSVDIELIRWKTAADSMKQL
uniref:leucine-rich repeat-containing protein 43-like n=1 Tax=Styela clava TaxID=7725 RepID=UPI0019398324|nr:leucine-rich repeat-containing protein 43-like [Styela clava]